MELVHMLSLTDPGVVLNGLTDLHGKPPTSKST